jgi:hypothetical protein
MNLLTQIRENTGCLCKSVRDGSFIIHSPFRDDVKNDKGKGKTVPVNAMKACRGSRPTAPLILNLGARFRGVTNITPNPGFFPRVTIG